MTYARWSNMNDLTNLVTSIDPKKTIEKSGLPMGYEKGKLLVNATEAHTLVIGSEGSGKTQSVVLPVLKMAISAGENFLVHDVNGELYDQLSSNLKEKGYQTIVLNFNGKDIKNYWNPFTLAHKLYQEGLKDEAITLVESIGYYLFETTSKNNNEDPFWMQTTINYFTGLVFYLFETSKEEVTLNKVYELSVEGMKKEEGKEHSKMREIVNNLSGNSITYINLSGTVLAPPETRGSILSVFNQKIKKYISRETISKLISFSDFDITKLGQSKTAIFVTSQENINLSSNFISLFVEQVIYSIREYSKSEKTFNIILDEFEKIVPIKDISSILSRARRLKIKFYLCIRSYLDLRNNYGKEVEESLKVGVGNIVYLLANDNYTLSEISDICGNVKANEPLITIEELRTLKKFEAVILVPRYMPIKTELLPDYKISW